MNNGKLNRRRQGALERLQAASNPHSTDTKEGAKKHAKWETRVVEEIAVLEGRLKHASI